MKNKPLHSCIPPSRNICLLTSERTDDESRLEKHRFTASALQEMNYRHLAIMLTSRCNAGCSFCCIREQLQNPADMELADFKNLLKAGREYNLGIGLSGGECFLHPHWQTICQMLKENDVKFSLISNGSWGTSLEDSYRTLQNLKHSGCQSITISTDDAHQKFIPLSRIIHIVHAARKAGLPHEIQTVRFHQDRIFWKETLLSQAPGCRITEFPGLPAGGARTYPSNLFIRHQSSRHQHCAKGQTLMITAKGSVYPCCSPAVEQTVLECGRISECGFEEIVENIRCNALLIVLRNCGFDPFLDYCDQKGIPYPKKVTDSCELCAFLFGRDMFFKLADFARCYVEENLR